MSLRKYTERIPLKEESDPVLRRSRLLKVGAGTVLITFGFIDGTIPDVISNIIDFAKNMDIADLTNYDPNNPSIIDEPVINPDDGVMS
jgi:hypothetical protein